MLGFMENSFQAGLSVFSRTSYPKTHLPTSLEAICFDPVAAEWLKLIRREKETGRPAERLKR
jgi:hypothetical protein